MDRKRINESLYAILKVHRSDVNGPVVQLVRTPPCHGGGQGFESPLGRFLLGTNPFRPGRIPLGILAQLGEHLPYKQGVTGSSPVGPSVLADMAQLAEQLICNQQVEGSSPPIGFFGPLAQLVRAAGS